MRVYDIDPEHRRKGRTADQMRSAPQGAVFIWPVTGSLSYARDLARHLGRDDLQVVGPTVLAHGGKRLRGRRLTAIVLDHAAWPSDEEYDTIDLLRASCVRPD